MDKGGISGGLLSNSRSKIDERGLILDCEIHRRAFR